MKAALALVLLYAAYDVIGTFLNARQAGIAYELASVKAGKCERTPSSQCFAELAVLSLPPHVRFARFDSTGRMLRYLGFGDFVDAKAKPPGDTDLRHDRSVQRIYDDLSADRQEFTAAPPIDDPFAYAFAFFYVQDDFPIVGAGDRSVMRAEETALERRGEPLRSAESLALLRKWRESLDRYGDTGLQWLFYSRRARELGETEEAKSSLARALETGLYKTSDREVVFQTLHLYGREQAYRQIESYPDTNFRATAHLALATHALTLDDVDWAADAFARFEDNYDAAEPVRHLSKWSDMANSAALVAHRLGNSDKALFWADDYSRQISYTSRPASDLYAGKLYADIGAIDAAAAHAYEAIAHATPPGESFGAPLLGFERQSTTPQHESELGRSIGVLCHAGQFEQAFSLAGKNHGYGPSASSDCVTAMLQRGDTFDLGELENRLGPLAKRNIRTVYAAHLVEVGSYDRAAEIIARSLELPSSYEGLSRVHGNIAFLRLAVAMRDRPLTRRIMQAIAEDAGTVSANQSASTFASVATITKKWPGAF